MLVYEYVAVISLVPLPTPSKQNHVCDAISTQASGSKISGLIFRLFNVLPERRCMAEVVGRKGRSGLLGNGLIASRIAGSLQPLAYLRDPVFVLNHCIGYNLHQTHSNIRVILFLVRVIPNYNTITIGISLIAHLIS